MTRHLRHLSGERAVAVKHRLSKRPIIYTVTTRPVKATCCYGNTMGRAGSFSLIKCFQLPTSHWQRWRRLRCWLHQAHFDSASGLADIGSQDFTALSQGRKTFPSRLIVYTKRKKLLTSNFLPPPIISPQIPSQSTQPFIHPIPPRMLLQTLLTLLTLASAAPAKFLSKCDSVYESDRCANYEAQRCSYDCNSITNPLFSI